MRGSHHLECCQDAKLLHSAWHCCFVDAHLCYRVIASELHVLTAQTSCDEFAFVQVACFLYKATGLLPLAPSHGKATACLDTVLTTMHDVVWAAICAWPKTTQVGSFNDKRAQLQLSFAMLFQPHTQASVKQQFYQSYIDQLLYRLFSEEADEEMFAAQMVMTAIAFVAQCNGHCTPSTALQLESWLIVHKCDDDVQDFNNSTVLALELKQFALIKLKAQPACRIQCGSDNSCISKSICHHPCLCWQALRRSLFEASQWMWPIDINANFAELSKQEGHPLWCSQADLMGSEVTGAESSRCVVGFKVQWQEDTAVAKVALPGSRHALSLRASWTHNSVSFTARDQVDASETQTQLFLHLAAMATVKQGSCCGKRICNTMDAP